MENNKAGVFGRIAGNGVRMPGGEPGIARNAEPYARRGIGGAHRYNELIYINIY